MAYIKIMGVYYDFIKTLMENRYLVDVNFIRYKTFQDALSLGFDPEIWEEKNNNRVLIDGIEYKEFK